MPELLPVPAGPAALEVLPRLREALAGGAPVIPCAAEGPRPDLPPEATGTQTPAGVAVCVGTSGSTGAPKLAMLTTEALTASAEATHAVLGGPGRWLLSMPAHHVAGLQVLIRGLVAGTTPGVLDLTGGFTATGFARVTRELTGPGRRYTSLVPTQVARLLRDPEGRLALTAYDAVLVGGSAVPAPLLEQAAGAGVRLVTTYGMSETAGGCVYDGRPLPGTRVRRGEDGRLSLGGPTVASGYLGRPGLTAEVFTTDAGGTRWFRTDDVGHQDADDRWHVDGRVDEVITTGGLKVAPRVVEDALARAFPSLREVVALGTDDPEWGQVVTAVVVTDGPAPTLGEVRSLLRSEVPVHALPRRVVRLDEIPMRGPGKPDRRSLRARLG